MPGNCKLCIATLYSLKPSFVVYMMKQKSWYAFKIEFCYLNIYMKYCLVEAPMWSFLSSIGWGSNKCQLSPRPLLILALGFSIKPPVKRGSYDSYFTWRYHVHLITHSMLKTGSFKLNLTNYKLIFSDIT